MELARPLSLIAIKDELRRLEGRPSSTSPPFATGWASIDALLGGGLPRGRVTEIIGARSSGKTTLALAAVAHATASGLLAVYVDARHELYPPAAAQLGVVLDRLLVVTPTPSPLAAARAVEIVLTSRAFPLVLLDLPDGQRLEGAAAARLRIATSDAAASLVVLGDRDGAAQAAAVRLAVMARRAAWGRTLAVTVKKGGTAPPGSQAEVAFGATTSFWQPEHQAALLAALPTT